MLLKINKKFVKFVDVSLFIYVYGIEIFAGIATRIKKLCHYKLSYILISEPKYLIVKKVFFFLYTIVIRIYYVRTIRYKKTYAVI